MGKIVGKIFVTLLSFYVVTVGAGIRLEMRTADGVAHNSAIIGQPFLIEAIIDGVQGSVQAPHIEGLNNFFAKRTGMYMSSINGVSTTKYTYQVRIDTPGNYTIGPARLMHQQQELISNSLSVSVTNANVSPSPQTNVKNNKKNDLKVFLRLMVDVDHVVVGQKINATLRFYYQDSSLSLVNIGQADTTGFDVKPIEKPVGGTVDVNGVHYKYAEWQWHMYPTKAGEFMIPAYSADYEIPVKDNNLLAGFFMFMNARSDRKRVYSNAIKITVDPLPHYHMPVKAVGVFDSIVAHITPPVVKEGEGMILTLEISGNGNMSAIDVPVLSMPSALKYYDSNVTVLDVPNTNHSVKKFEFVVQGMESGDWEIPEQSFVYYDIDKHEYVTLKTSPMSVSIQPSLYKPLITSSPKDDESNQVKIVREQAVIDSINNKGPWYPVSERTPIPWMIFYCMLCAPMLYIGYPALGRWLLRFNTVKRMKKKKACKDACKKIIISMNKNDDTVVYSIVTELIAFLTNQPLSLLSRNYIESYLKELNFSDYDIQEWHVFFVASAHAAYTQSNSKKAHELCRMAIKWLERLEKAL